MKAAIYHFTDKSEKRPIVFEKQVANLEEFASSMNYDVEGIFCDNSLLRSERKEFNRFLASSDSFDVLITKDFYHISKNTGECFRILSDLGKDSIIVMTLENGSFVLEEAPCDKPLRVATYTCHFDKTYNAITDIKNDIFKLYIDKKTKWSLIDQYYDEGEAQTSANQVELEKLIQNRHKYDLLLVQNMNDINWRTANFCKVREQLQLDIYSLQQGFLRYGRTF